MVSVPYQLVEQSTREMMFASPSFLSLELTAEASITLLGTIQLCLRHPLLGDRSRSTLEELAERIQCQLASLGPATRELCRLGWDAKNDPEAA